MVIEMFNGWYFLWLALAIGATVGLYFLLRKAKPSVQKIVLFSILVLGFALHFLKLLVPPYSDNHSRFLSDSWFVNICAANIAVFPFLFWSKRKAVKDYMFYIGVLSGLLALFYPQEAIGKVGCEIDIIRFYFHHWMLVAVPLLMVLLNMHKISWKRVWAAPVGLLILMLFIILNQFFQSELGFIELRGSVDKLIEINGEQYVLTEFAGDPIMIGEKQYVAVDYWDSFRDVDWKNSSYIYSPNFTETSKDPIGAFFATFCPDFFRTVPAGPYAGQEKFWPWFWVIVPIFVLVTPLSFGLAVIFDRKNLIRDIKSFTWRGLLRCLTSPFRRIKARFVEDDPPAELDEGFGEIAGEIALAADAVVETVEETVSVGEKEE